MKGQTPSSDIIQVFKRHVQIRSYPGSQYSVKHDKQQNKKDSFSLESAKVFWNMYRECQRLISI